MGRRPPTLLSSERVEGRGGGGEGRGNGGVGVTNSRGCRASRRRGRTRGRSPSGRALSAPRPRSEARCAAGIPRAPAPSQTVSLLLLLLLLLFFFFFFSSSSSSSHDCPRFYSRCFISLPMWSCLIATSSPSHTSPTPKATRQGGRGGGGWGRPNNARQKDNTKQPPAIQGRTNENRRRPKSRVVGAQGRRKGVSPDMSRIRARHISWWKRVALIWGCASLSLSHLHIHTYFVYIICGRTLGKRQHFSQLARKGRLSCA